MSLTRRHFALMGLAGVALPLAGSPAAARVPLVLEDFFRGRGKGTGTFTSDLFGIDRPFTVATRGEVTGRTLILHEDIAYADGQRESAVWRFDRRGPRGYDGQRSGVATVVPVRIEDGVVRMGYVAEVVGPDGTRRKLRFDDVLEQTDARTLVNTARVSFLGLTVGRVRVVFTR